MSVSNKTLAVLLLAAIVVSLGGTFISLNRLGALSTTGYQVSGENVTGDVRLAIQDVLSITIADQPEINFGTCELGEGAAGITIASNTTDGNEAGSCTGFAPVPIAVRNNGNRQALVTFNVSDYGTNVAPPDGTSGSFLQVGDARASPGTDFSELRYTTRNASWDGSVGANGGCLNTGAGWSAGSFALITATADITVCNVLDFSSTANSFLMDFQIKIPNAADQGDNVTITFIASEV